MLFSPNVYCPLIKRKSIISSQTVLSGKRKKAVQVS